MKKYKLLIKLLGFFILLLILSVGICRSVRLLWLREPVTLFPLNLKWQIDRGNSTYEIPVYESGLVILPVRTTLNTYWYGIDATTGQTTWSYQDEGENFRRCLTADYLVVSGDSSLTVLKTQTGELVWIKDITANRATCSQESVFFILTRGAVAANDILTGQVLWFRTNPEKSFNGLTYNPEAKEIIASEANAPEDLYIIHPKTGKLLRSFKEVGLAPTNNSWSRGPLYLVDQGQLFIGGTVLDARTGEIIHEENHYSTAVPPTLTTDTIYVASTEIVALDRATFEVKWQYHPQSKLEGISSFSILPVVVRSLSPLSQVAILNGVGYVIFTDMTLRAFDLETGRELGYWQPSWFDLWRSPLCDTPFPIPGCSLSARAGLATSADMLFVSFGDGKLYAFGQ